MGAINEELAGHTQCLLSTHCGQLTRCGAAVSQPYIIRSAAFLNRLADQCEPMDIEHLDYAQLSEEAMAAADGATSLDECQAHLDRAVRYAQLACLEHQRSPDFHVVEIRPGVRRQS